MMYSKLLTDESHFYQTVTVVPWPMHIIIVHTMFVKTIITTTVQTLKAWIHHPVLCFFNWDHHDSILCKRHDIVNYFAQHQQCIPICTVLAGELPYLILFSAASLSSCSRLNAYCTAATCTFSVPLSALMTLGHPMYMVEFWGMHDDEAY